jgi:hypothetical protein
MPYSEGPDAPDVQGLGPPRACLSQESSLCLADRAGSLALSLAGSRLPVTRPVTLGACMACLRGDTAWRRICRQLLTGWLRVCHKLALSGSCQARAAPSARRLSQTCDRMTHRPPRGNSGRSNTRAYLRQARSQGQEPCNHGFASLLLDDSPESIGCAALQCCGASCTCLCEAATHIESRDRTTRSHYSLHGLPGGQL